METKTSHGVKGAYKLNLTEINKYTEELCNDQIRDIKKEVGGIIFSKFKHSDKDEEGFIDWRLAKEIHLDIFKTGWTALDLNSRFYSLGSKVSSMIISDFYPKILRMESEIKELKKTISYLEKRK